MNEQTTMEMRTDKSGMGWKIMAAISWVLLLAVVGGGAWLYTLYDGAISENEELVLENGRLIDLAEESRENEASKTSWRGNGKLHIAWNSCICRFSRS